MAQVLCECPRQGYWFERAENGEPLFCFRTRHDGENHAVKLTLGQIIMAGMPKMMNEQQPDSLDVTATYVC